MTYILLIETADEVCSVGLSANGRLINKEEIIEKNAHSRLINTLIESLLNKSNLSFSEIDAIAVSKGPGSYTGLRIGTATAKAFCYALNIPLISINTLQSLATNFNNAKPVSEDVFLMPMLDARRMEVYTALYNSQIIEVMPTTALVLSETVLSTWTQNKKVILFGNGANKCNDFISNMRNVSVVDDIHPSVNGMLTEANNLFIKNKFEDIVNFEPFYLKDFMTTAPKKLF